MTNLIKTPDLTFENKICKFDVNQKREMTTLTIEIPDDATADISILVKEKGGSVLNIETDDEDLSAEELQLLKRGLIEAIAIKEGRIKSIPFSELWND